MDTLTAIHTRRSIREYQDKNIPEELVLELLKAAMASPSARNQQPWEFVVITDPGLRNQIPAVCPFAQMIVDAPLAILVCGNLKIETAQGYWEIDCAAATQNLLLAAHALGLGAVWLGVHPHETLIDGTKKLFNIPDHVTPLGIISLGYPEETKPPRENYNPERVHRNKW